MFSQIDEVVRGDGKVVPSGQTKVLQHMEGGLVAEILVKEGDRVSMNQPIYRLDQAFYRRPQRERFGENIFTGKRASANKSHRG